MDSKALLLPVLVAVLSGCGQSSAPDVDSREAADARGARVVAATFDTGTNPFHPCFRREGSPLDSLPELAGIARPLELTFEKTYAKSLEASQAALAAVRPFTLYAVEGTRLLVYTGINGGADLIDVYPHGAQASSQIVCEEYGMAPNALLVVLNWYTNTGSDQARLEEWAGQQEWIDVIHLNIQRITPWPFSSATQENIRAMVDAGKAVVIAAGNGWGNAGGHIPTETVDFYSIPGILAAGASDQEGYTLFSNLDPHTVMDGCNTESAEPAGFRTTSFGGTSSASPRTTGYVSELLRQLRAHYGAPAGTSGSVLVQVTAERRPASGPLADGLLTVHEFHEVIRKTADPTLAASQYDGTGCVLYGVPRPVNPEGHDYHRVGYGKLSEHTIGHALAVLKGEAPMPERPTEDMYYELSGTVRDTVWEQ